MMMKVMLLHRRLGRTGSSAVHCRPVRQWRCGSRLVVVVMVLLLLVIVARSVLNLRVPQFVLYRVLVLLCAAVIIEVVVVVVVIV